MDSPSITSVFDIDEELILVVGPSPFQIIPASGHGGSAIHPWHRVTEIVFDFLDVSEPPRSVDCIFVLAGRQERKTCGIGLWRLGLAPELILSVGRFEWRRFYQLDLPSDGGLRRLVDATPPRRRHFFVRLREERAESRLIPFGRLGTRAEARALAALLRGSAIRSVMLVSTSIHLRRAVMALRCALSRADIEVHAAAVPDRDSSLRRSEIRRSRRARREVWLELAKYVGYRLACLVP